MKLTLNPPMELPEPAGNAREIYHVSAVRGQVLDWSSFRVVPTIASLRFTVDIVPVT